MDMPKVDLIAGQSTVLGNGQSKVGRYTVLFPIVWAFQVGTKATRNGWNTI